MRKRHTDLPTKDETSETTVLTVRVFTELLPNIKDYIYY